MRDTLRVSLPIYAKRGIKHVDFREIMEKSHAAHSIVRPWLESA